MKRKLAPWLAVGLMLVGLAVVAPLAWRQRPAPVPPAPNGYDAILRAGQMVHPPPVRPAGLTAAQLEDWVAANRTALNLARSGLSNRCRVPVEYSAGFLTNHVPLLGRIKLVGQAFHAEGRLAVLEGRDADATVSYLDCIRLGNAVGQDGLMVDRLTGMACELMGLEALEAMVGRMGLSEARAAIRELEAIDRTSPTVEETLANDQRLAPHLLSPGWRFLYQFRDVLPMVTVRQSSSNFVSQAHRATRQRRQLMVDLAARAFESEWGRRPGTVSDLVPRYLESVPMDPASDQPLGVAPPR